MAVSMVTTRGLPEPTIVMVIDDRRQGQCIDRRFELPRRLACSIHGTQARPAHIYPAKRGLPSEQAGLRSSREGSQSQPSGNLNREPISDDAPGVGLALDDRYKCRRKPRATSGGK